VNANGHRTSLTQALGIYRELGVRGSEAEVLNDLGEVLARFADSRQALDHHTQALAIARAISAPLEEARAREGSGHCLLRDGNIAGAATQWHEALAIYQQIGAPDAQRVQEILCQHGSTAAAGLTRT